MTSTDYNQSMELTDIYCEKILTGEIPVEVIKETPNILAFKHTKPYWKTHVVIIPKKHIESFTTIANDDEIILHELIKVANAVCTEIEKIHGGCRLSTNIGSFQSSKHLHFYAHAGERLKDNEGNSC